MVGYRGATRRLRVGCPIQSRSVRLSGIAMQYSINHLPSWVFVDLSTQVSVQKADANLGHHHHPPSRGRGRPRYMRRRIANSVKSSKRFSPSQKTCRSSRAGGPHNSRMLHSITFCAIEWGSYAACDFHLVSLITEIIPAGTVAKSARRAAFGLDTTSRGDQNLPKSKCSGFILPRNPASKKQNRRFL